MKIYQPKFDKRILFFYHHHLMIKDDRDSSILLPHLTTLSMVLICDCNTDKDWGECCRIRGVKGRFFVDSHLLADTFPLQRSYCSSLWDWGFIWDLGGFDLGFWGFDLGFWGNIWVLGVYMGSGGLGIRR